MITFESADLVNLFIADVSAFIGRHSLEIFLTILGILIPLFFSIRNDGRNASITKEIKDNIIKNNEIVSRINNSIKILRISFFRQIYELSIKLNSEDTNYWHFKWRFETCNSPWVSVYSFPDKNFLGECNIDIEGFNNKSDELNIDLMDYDAYKVNIRNICRGPGVENFPFKEDDKALCFMRNVHHVISKGVDPFTLESQFIIELVSPQTNKIIYGTKTVDNIKIYPRIKDS